MCKKKPQIYYLVQSRDLALHGLKLSFRKLPWSVGCQKPEQGGRVSQFSPTDCRRDSGREVGIVSWELRCKTRHSSGQKTVGTEKLDTSKMIICVLSKLYRKNSILSARYNKLFKALFVFYSFSYQTQEKPEKVWKHPATWLYLSL